jgi:hypothetical protein
MSAAEKHIRPVFDDLTNPDTMVKHLENLKEKAKEIKKILVERRGDL